MKIGGSPNDKAQGNLLRIYVVFLVILFRRNKIDVGVADNLTTDYALSGRFIRVRFQEQREWA